MKTKEQIAREAAEEMDGFVRLSWIDDEYRGFDDDAAYQVILRAINEAESADIFRKITVVDATIQIFGGLRAVVSVLKGQRDAKARAKQGEWCDGYAAAMDDAIKSLESFVEESDGAKIEKAERAHFADLSDKLQPPS